MPVNKDDYALVIGINDYPKYGTHGRNLKGAIRDAKEFHRWLIDANTGGGVPKENCRLVLSCSDPLAPGYDGVDREYRALHEQVKKAKGGRRFYFFFSGNGQLSASLDGGEDEVHLCLPEWSRSAGGAALSLSQYRQRTLKCFDLQEIVMFLDCCSSQQVSAIGQNTMLTCDMPQKNVKKTDTFIAFASEYSAKAFEDTVAGKNDEPIVHVHFTTALLTALRGEAADPSGGVRISMLHRYLERNVPRIANRAGQTQVPRFRPFSRAMSGPDEPIFGSAPKVNTIDVKICFKASRAGEMVLEGPNARAIRRGDTSTGPWEETLQAGVLHVLRDVSTGDFWGFRPQRKRGGASVKF